MGLAFWRSKKRAGNAAAKPATRPSLPQDDDVDARLDPAAGLRARARYRLIGAAALLLAVAIIVPMVLDPEPRPVTENIPIDIPSERTPFTPRLSLPPVPAADAAVTPPPDQAPATSDAKAASKSEVKIEPKAATKADDGKTPEAEEPRAQAAEAKAPEAPALPAAAKGGRFAVQAAAPASEKAARDLADRMKKAGFNSYIEKVDTKDGTRFRVRLGPYATREEAERVRAKLKSLGFAGNLVTV